MDHIQLFKVKNDSRISHEAADKLPETGVINIFFAGAMDFGKKNPNDKIKKAVIEYLDDRKIADQNWHLYFAQQKNPIADPDDNSVEKLNRILDYNAFDHHYLREHLDFVNNVLLPKEFAPPLKRDDGTKAIDEDAAKAVYTAKMRLSRFNLMGFCYGTIAVQQVLLAMDRVLRDRGYDKEQIKDIRSSLCCMNYAPICQIPEKNQNMPQLFFASGIDEIAKRRIDYTETYGKTCPEFDMHQLGNSLVLVSHLVAAIPKALRLTRDQYDLSDPDQTNFSISKHDDGFHQTLLKIRLGQVKVKELSVRDDPIERMGHNLRTWFNLERLTGKQTREGRETFAFPSTLFARWAHDIVLDSIKASKASEETGVPRNMQAIMEAARESLTPEDIQRRIDQFNQAEGRYQMMVDAARSNGTLITRNGP
jgi:hypothetical protein